MNLRYIYQVSQSTSKTAISLSFASVLLRAVVIPQHLNMWLNMWLASWHHNILWSDPCSQHKFGVFSASCRCIAPELLYCESVMLVELSDLSHFVNCNASKVARFASSEISLNFPSLINWLSKIVSDKTTADAPASIYPLIEPDMHSTTRLEWFIHQLHPRTALAVLKKLEIIPLC